LKSHAGAVKAVFLLAWFSAISVEYSRFMIYCLDQPAHIHEGVQPDLLIQGRRQTHQAAKDEELCPRILISNYWCPQEKRATHRVRHDDIFHAIDKVDTEICPSGNSAKYRGTCLCSCKLMYYGSISQFPPTC
jgi:hypothetical protein